jgi:predicted nucleotidyltransferase
MQIIEAHKDALLNLCKNHHVKSLSVFGSVLTSDFNAESDLDFAVVFNRDELTNADDFGDNYLDFILGLEKEFKRDVDVVNEENIKNPYFANVLKKTKKLFYAA